MYEVVQDFYLQEQGIQLEIGMQFSDGDLDPDVIASLLSQGVIVDPSVSPAKYTPDYDPEKNKRQSSKR